MPEKPQQDSEPTGYLEKAVEAATIAEYGDWSELGEDERKECREAVRRGLEAAAPFIRADERARFQASFYSQLEASGWSSGEEIPMDEIEGAMQVALNSESDQAEDGDREDGWPERAAYESVAAAGRFLLDHNAGHPSRPSARRSAWNVLARALARIPAPKRATE